MNAYMRGMDWRKSAMVSSNPCRCLIALDNLCNNFVYIFVHLNDKVRY